MLPDTAAGLVFDYNGGGFTAVAIPVLPAFAAPLIIPITSLSGR